MSISRRRFLAAATGACVPLAIGSASDVDSSIKPFRVSTEETFGIPEIYEATAKLIQDHPVDEVGLGLPPPQSPLVSKLMDLGEGRIAEMDRAGIDMQVLSLWSPGVQIFEPIQASDLARLANDRIAQAIGANPQRFAGLVTIAPQDPEKAALEIERGMSTLGLNGVLINSYTNGEYLDDTKYWPIFEAAQAHNAAIYLHPRKPPPHMYEPFSKYSMDGAMWGFHAEVSTHAIRLLLSGVFDQFPRLTIVLGHMGEGLPFWMDRLDSISTREDLSTIKRKPSDYIRNNIIITTSAMFWNPILDLSRTVLGSERIMFAVDYPFGSSEAGVEWLDAASLPSNERRLIYAENAKRVFHIK